MRRDRRTVGRIENALIVCLACLALVLVSRTSFFQALPFLPHADTAQGAAVGQGASLAHGAPTALAFTTEDGRFGVQGDADSVATLWDGGLRDLLDAALAAAERPSATTRTAWQEAIAGEEGWVWYDLLYDVPFADRGEGGAARRFLLTARGGHATALYLYCQEEDAYYVCRLSDPTLALPELVRHQAANGAVFAFEDPAYAGIDPDQLVTRAAPRCPVYTAESALAALDADLREGLMDALDFNQRAASVYQSAEGQVVREGADTLRLQTDGTVSFHGSESGKARYMALSPRTGDLRDCAQELFDRLTEGRIGPAALYCCAVETGEDGATVLSWRYRLAGAEVWLDDADGLAAQATFRGTALTAFWVRAMTFTETEEGAALPPARQAAAAASDGEGRELRLCYRLADGRAEAGWALMLDREG